MSNPNYHGYDYGPDQGRHQPLPPGYSNYGGHGAMPGPIPPVYSQDLQMMPQRRSILGGYLHFLRDRREHFLIKFLPILTYTGAVPTAAATDVLLPGIGFVDDIPTGAFAVAFGIVTALKIRKHRDPSRDSELTGDALPMEAVNMIGGVYGHVQHYRENHRAPTPPQQTQNQPGYAWQVNPGQPQLPAAPTTPTPQQAPQHWTDPAFGGQQTEQPQHQAPQRERTRLIPLPQEPPIRQYQERDRDFPGSYR